MSIRDTIDYDFTNPGPFVPAAKPRNQAESAKPFHQIREALAIFILHRREFQPQFHDRALHAATTASALICPSSTRK